MTTAVDLQCSPFQKELYLTPAHRIENPWLEMSRHLAADDRLTISWTCHLASATPDSL